jgi:hypothetical protein
VITPRLHRRALAQAAQWRLLLLWWASLAVPGVIAALPVSRFLREALDHSTRAKESVAFIDGSTLIELARRLEQNGNLGAVGLGLSGAVLALVLVAPFMAGAVVTAARTDESLPVTRLLAGSGELYGRMLRTFLCGLVPLGIFGGLAAGILKLAGKAMDRDLTETAADAHLRAAIIAAAVAFFLGHLLVDAARAVFAAEPLRRSAVLAMWRAVRLVVRRPLRSLSVGGLGTLAGLGSAAILMSLRLRVTQSGALRIAIAWGLAQAAQVAIGWGRGARIFGLAELARADAADRARPFRLEPPATSPPPPVVQSTTLSALSAEGAPLSPKDASGR